MSSKVFKKTLSHVKQLPVELSTLHANDDNGFWAWASREIIDSSGDLVKVEGIDLTEYHQPEEGVHLKVLAQHMTQLPNGEVPVVGIVMDYKIAMSPYKGQMVKGLAIYIQWLRDPKTNELMPLAKHYKSMKEASGVDQTSIGFLCQEGDYVPNNNGGFDFNHVSMFELSLVTIPANASANFIKLIEQQAGNLVDVNLNIKEEDTEKAPLPESAKGVDAPETVTPEIEQPVVDASSNTSTDDSTNLKAITESLKTLEALVASMAATINTQQQPAVPYGHEDIVKAFQPLCERLDLIESALVVLSGEKAQLKDDRKSVLADEEQTKFTNILKQLEKTISHLDK